MYTLLSGLGITSMILDVVVKLLLTGVLFYVLRILKDLKDVKLEKVN